MDYDRAIAAQFETHPALRATARPGNAARIAALEAGMGPLAPDRRRFLEQFGGGRLTDGTLPDMCGLDLGIDALTEALAPPVGVPVQQAALSDPAVAQTLVDLAEGRLVPGCPIDDRPWTPDEVARLDATLDAILGGSDDTASALGTPARSDQVLGEGQAWFADRIALGDPDRD